MEQNRCLGIYVEPGRATVVLAAKAGSRIEVAEQFCIAAPEPTSASAAEPGQSFNFSQTAKDIAAACQEKQLVFTDIAVAIDCRLYRQQTLHSEFTDQKQISQTIKFDAEEALAINAAEAAVSFEVASKGLSGSEVSVFAVQAEIMSEIILALQNHKLDPVTVEPDSICLRRIIQQIPQPGSDERPIWAALSRNKCFIISPPSQSGNAAVRAFLTGANANRSGFLAREIILTIASNAAARQVRKIRVFDSQAGIDLAALGEQAGLAAEVLAPEEIITKPQEQTDCDSLDMIIAAGAAAGVLVKSERVDFRPFFLPYQGKKAAVEETIKVLSISLTVMFIALGIFFYLQYYRVNSYRNRLEKKFGAEYSIAMTGAKFTRSSEAVRRLKSEINRIKDVKSGILSSTGEDSVEAKLAYLFEAINSVPPGVDIEIEKVTVTTTAMTITGNTSSRGYLELLARLINIQNLKGDNRLIRQKRIEIISD